MNDSRNDTVQAHNNCRPFSRKRSRYPLHALDLRRSLQLGPANENLSKSGAAHRLQAGRGGVMHEPTAVESSGIDTPSEALRINFESDIAELEQNVCELEHRLGSWHPSVGREYVLLYQSYRRQNTEDSLTKRAQCALTRRVSLLNSCIFTCS